jgi:hypothetical protein
MLRRLFGSKRREVAKCWRRLHKEELRSFYALQNIATVIKIKDYEMGGK